jgi:hypothetical protein
LQYGPVTEIDLARFDLWTRQILVDAASGDPSGVTRDVTTMELVWHRISHALDATSTEQIMTHLETLRRATEGEDLRAAADAATQLHDFLVGLGLTS